MYAVVKTGGKQYRLEQGQTLLVERLSADEGASVKLEPLLYVDGDTFVDGDDLSKVTVAGEGRGPRARAEAADRQVQAQAWL